MAAGQNSNRWSWMMNWRWTVSANMVNEVRGGLTGGPVKFGDGISRDAYSATGSPFADWQGWLPYPSTALISQMFTGISGSSRDAPTQVLEDTFSWLKGKHSINVGASWTNIGLSYFNVLNSTPYLNFGTDTADPAAGMFTTDNFPGANGTQLGQAMNLYGFLTGRITGIRQTAYLGGDGNYANLGDAYQKAHETELGFYIQDSWKARPDLTVSYGIRYELQMPFKMDNAYFSRPLNYCNSFGVSGCTADGLSANLFAPGSGSGDAHAVARVRQHRAGLQHGQEQLGAELRRRVASAHRQQRLAPEDPERGPGHPRRLLESLHP